MTIFEKIKSMDVGELAEWLDTYGMFDGSPWINWWDNTYCKKCASEEIYNEHLDEYDECAWCEIHKKCRYFQDMDEIPSCKQIVKMWLELEDE